MRREPLVSIVVTNYNYASYLPAALDGALAQSYRRTEVVVVDDGSTDGSRDILARYGGRVRAVLQENRGQAAALSAGVKASQGELLCLLDADDVWHPEKVSRVVSAFGENPRAGWLRHRLALSDDELQPLGPAIPAFRGSGWIPPETAVYVEGRATASTSALSLRRDVAQRVFPLPERTADGTSLVWDADALLISLMGAEGAWGWSLDEVLGSYRMHGGQRFAGAEALTRLIERQREVALASARAFADRREERPRVPTSVHKHAAILAALEGEPPWGRRRLGSAAAGLGGALRILPENPVLGARQAAAVGFAWAAPERWLRRYLHDPGFTLRSRS